MSEVKNTRISLKNIKHSESLSEETNAFTADVYLDNRKFGYAKNDGRGGSTNIQCYADKKRIFTEAEKYADTIIKETYDGAIEDIVDDIIYVWTIEKEKKKHMRKGIYYKDSDGVEMGLTWGSKNPISKMLKSPSGIKAIQETVDNIKEKGGTILNTNFNGKIKI